jgi:hypothetical protein
MTDYSLAGGCPCGKIKLEVHLTSEPGMYRPRACDCRFCVEHGGAAYISDVKGMAIIYSNAISDLKFVRQGDEIAEFLLCATCSQLLGALWRRDQRQHGCVNADSLFGKEFFGEKLSASPKNLDAKQKTERWRQLWFPVFRIVTALPSRQ